MSEAPCGIESRKTFCFYYSITNKVSLQGTTYNFETLEVPMLL